MDIIELQGRLILLTKSNISFTDIGKILDIGRAGMSGRADRRTEMSKEELEKVEKHYGVKLDNVHVYFGASDEELMKEFEEIEGKISSTEFYITKDGYLKVKN